MVHVARGRLADAETVLHQGAAVQDRQIDRGERYPALGLHWLLGLVRLAQDDVEEALRELEKERALAEPHRLYGREYTMHALHARGACLLRLGRTGEAIESFGAAIELYPDHGPSHVALAIATGREIDLDATLATLAATRPIEAAILQSQVLAAKGHAGAAGEILSTLLDEAPPGFAAWTLPVEPLLHQLTGTKEFTDALARLARRASGSGPER